MPRRKPRKTRRAKPKLVKSPKPDASNSQRDSNQSSPWAAATLDLTYQPGLGSHEDQERNSRKRPGQNYPPAQPAQSATSVAAVPKRKRELSSGEGAEVQPPRSPPVRSAGDDVSTVTPSEAKRRCAELAQATFTSSYSVGELLGSGGCGSVYAGTRKSDGTQVAIKYIPKTKAKKYIIMRGDDRRLPLEVALMTMVSQPSSCCNVLKLLDWFEEPFRYILVLERPSPCSDLFDFCGMFNGRLSEVQARQILRQVVEALIHCRNCGVFHRDVKSENILVNRNDWTVKLIDFGCGDLYKEAPYSNFAGTLNFCPPEYFLNGSYEASPATTWSVGVLLFELVCGDLPFEGRREIILNQPRFTTRVSKGRDVPTVEMLTAHLAEVELCFEKLSRN
ncbi:serine/threonine-protein kinase pim-1-like isoform X2 [Alosa sapidissima]|uniref:serine/threonine-protein kinase pim-1-like isoform X2 n=1 Tax=Alosa sapidissima TaxID=34773 RepID=UPI001C0963F4|nr:serine/threonine-protein kinase pim-1-like isoform X2 [Alosa sapidissima]